MNRDLNWDYLLENRCPSCGEEFEKSGDDFICRNHQGNPFKISGFKFTKIMRGLQEREDFKPPPFSDF